MTPPDESQPVKPSPWSLAALAAGAIAGCLIVVAAAKYYLVEIPVLKTEIRNRDAELACLQQRAWAVRQIDAQIGALKERVVLLDALDRGRVRHSRVLDRLCTSISAQEGVCVRSFRILPDVAPPPPGAGPGDKRYVMAVSGAVLGASAKERDDKLSALLGFLAQDFGAGGYDKGLRATFQRPVLMAREAQAAALLFTLRISYETAPEPPPPADDEPPFIFEPGERRSPFAPK